MKKYVIVFWIKEGKYYRTYTTQPETKNEVKKALMEMPYNWEVDHIYEVTQEVDKKIFK